MSRLDKITIKKHHRASGYAQPNEPRVGARIALNRMRNLGLLFNACGRDEERLAEFLLLPIGRVRGLLDGEIMISNELAMHIESEAQLPEGWLDKQSPVIPDAVLARARGAEPEQPPVKAEPAVATVEVAPAPQPEAVAVPQVQAQPPAAESSVEPEIKPAAPKKRVVRSVTGKHIGRPFTVTFETAEARREALRQALDARGKGARLALSKQVGVGISVVSSWLSGRRRITDTWARKIAQALPEADMKLDAAPPARAVEAARPLKSEIVPEVGQTRPTEPDTAKDELQELRDICVRVISRQKDPAKLARILADIL